MRVEGKVGPSPYSDGTEPPLRLGKDGAQIVQDGHARYAEQVIRGGTFTAWWSGGTPGTVAAGNVSATGSLAGAPTVLAGLVNPQNSGKNLIVCSLTFGTISGTIPATGPIWLAGYSASGSVTASATAASANNGVVNNLLGQGNPIGRAIIQAAVTGSPAITPLRPAFTVPAVSASAREETAGEIVVPPGAGIAIVPSGAGTTWITTGSICWEEVPV